MMRRPPRSPLFPYPPLFRSLALADPPVPGHDRRHAEPAGGGGRAGRPGRRRSREAGARRDGAAREPGCRSEEHTSELQSQSNLVCRLLLEKKKLSSALILIL